MEKIQIIFNILMTGLMIPPCIVAYQQMRLDSSVPRYWPFILFFLALIGSAGLQVWAAVLNRKKFANVPVNNVGGERAQRDLGEIYGDCIYDWATENRRGNALFSADQLIYHLNLSQGQIDMGLNHLNALRAIEPNGFQWRIDPCHPVVPRFRRLWIVR